MGGMRRANIYEAAGRTLFKFNGKDTVGSDQAAAMPFISI